MNYVRPVLLRLLTPAGVIFGSTHVLSQISYCDSKNINDSFHHPRFVKSNGKRVIGLGAAGVDYIVSNLVKPPNLCK